MAKLRTSVRNLLRPRLGVAVALVVPWLVGCPPPVVGTPCNHGDVAPPESKLVTFPALSCDRLLCVYADDEQPPTLTGGCSSDADCNTPGQTVKFECVTNNPAQPSRCQLRIDYVLERSMCSKRCSSDADCKDGGVGEKVVADDTNCETGFKCARIQTLGKFCCEKLCVCDDDLGITMDIDTNCSASTQEGCCVDGSGEPISPLPDACGKP